MLVIRVGMTKHKHAFLWIGPRTVTKAIKEFVYLVKDLIKNEVEQVHATRMILYNQKWRKKPV